MLRQTYLTYLFCTLAVTVSIQVTASSADGLPVSYYFGYYLEDSIDSSTIHLLEKEGYEIVETDSIERIIYVKTTHCRSTPESIEQKLKKVVYMGSSENKSATEKGDSRVENNFDFLNVFFFTL